MALDNDLLARWYRLLDEYEHCEGYVLRSRLDVFRISLLSFNRNFENLMDTVAAMKPDDEPTDDTIFEFRDKTDPKMFEVCHCLQNFVSSAMTLVDQSRVVYKKMYKPYGKIADYCDEVKKRFMENELHQFIQGLRNMTVHYRAPSVGYTEQRQIGIGFSSVSFQVYLQKGDLLQFEGWNQYAERFLENHGDRIDLAKVMGDYHQLVVDFHDWFAVRQREAHSQQLEEVERLESELRQLARDIRQRHQEKLLSKRTDDPQDGG